MSDEIITWILNTEFVDWLQFVSVLMATIAAVMSCVSVMIATKQLKLNEEQAKLKIKPVFRIRQIHRTPDGFFLDIENLGHPFFYIINVEFTTDDIYIKNDFNGEVGTDRKSAQDSFIINVKVNKRINTTGYFTVSFIDVQGNRYVQKTPVFKIENRKIKNGIDIHKQYLRDE